MQLNASQNIYEQIAEMIENEILSNRLGADDQAPSTNQFAKVYQINPATALKGMNQLVDEGILYKKRGMGMFVTTDAKEIIIQKRKTEFQKTMLPSMIDEAKRLNLNKEEFIKLIEEVSWDD